MQAKADTLAAKATAQAGVSKPAAATAAQPDVVLATAVAVEATPSTAANAATVMVKISEV